MTREEAIFKLKDLLIPTTLGSKCIGEFDREPLKMAIKALEQEPRWIPISERLPESDGDYLVTEKSGRVCTYVFHKEGNSEEYWKRCTVAWMELPKSYKVLKQEPILDKIRAEIEQDAIKSVFGTKYIFVDRVNQILDKYKAESEK